MPSVVLCVELDEFKNVFWICAFQCNKANGSFLEQYYSITFLQMTRCTKETPGVVSATGKLHVLYYNQHSM